MALPLPHRSSAPLKVVLLAASWQLRLVIVGSRIVNVLPDCVVLSVTGLGPFQAEVPVPYRTCSCSRSTAPVSASTSTVSRLMPLAPKPSTVDSHASRGVAPSAFTTSWVPSRRVTLRSRPVAIVSAATWLSVGVIEARSIGCSSALELKASWPAPSITITKSPPTTGSPA